MTIARFEDAPRFHRGSVLFAAVLFTVFILLPAAAAEHGAAIPRISQQTPVAGPQEPLTPELTLMRWSISDLHLSPDGNRLAMVVSEPAKPSGQRRNIWIYSFEDHLLRPFTGSPKSDSRPRWSPDGRTLAFLSNREGSSQIYLIPLDGGEARPLTESKTGIASFEWAPDGQRIVLETTAPRTEEEEKKEKEKDDARLAGRPEERTLLLIMDIESRTFRTLIQGAWRIGDYAWMPDGASLILSATDNPQRELYSEKIYRVSTTDGKMTLFASPPGPFGNLQVSPDGRFLAFEASRGDGPEAHDLFIQPITGGPAVNLTARSIDRPVGSYIWESAERLLLTAATGFSNTFFTVILDGKAEKSGWTPPLLVGSYARGKNGLAFVGESATEAPELWIAPAAGSPEKVSHFNKDWDDVRLLRPEIIRYASFDHQEIEAALLKPEDARPGAKLPAVILVHGGPTGAWTNRFDAWGQLLVAHGFVVLSPNIRGSTGYGWDFMVANRFDWGGGDFKDVMAGADWLVEQGIADRDRIGIGGWSYGGYMAAWAVTQTTFFQASVSGAPMTDLALEYGAEDAGINSYDTWFMGNPYENLPLFAGRSPVTFVKQVKTPTLLLCGEDDTTDPVEQCYQFHRGLRRFSVDTELVVYPREGHGIREEKHRIDVLDRVVGWFEKYLKR
jgi:dipeptidyl aminopeptidase/acylaminoacyl peptidase